MKKTHTISKEVFDRVSGGSWNRQSYSNVFDKKDYYSAGEIEFGVHGPEEKDGNTYLSVYHFLEFVGKNPRKYETYDLGSYLTDLSSGDIMECKYLTQSFKINKFNLNLLKKEESNFQRFYKK